MQGFKANFEVNEEKYDLAKLEKDGVEVDLSNGSKYQIKHLTVDEKDERLNYFKIFENLVLVHSEPNSDNSIQTYHHLNSNTYVGQLVNPSGQTVTPKDGILTNQKTQTIYKGKFDTFSKFDTGSLTQPKKVLMGQFVNNKLQTGTAELEVESIGKIKAKIENFLPEGTATIDLPNGTQIQTNANSGVIPYENDQELKFFGKNLQTIFKGKKSKISESTEGETYSSNGTQTTGTHKAGILHGEGTKRNPSKFIKETKGNFYSGFLNNNGTETYKNDAVYTGKMILSRRHGTGKLEWPNGETYEGEFFGGVKQGHGVYKWPNGDVYDGHWLNNRIEGFGVLSLASGEKLEGEWKNGEISENGDDGNEYLSSVS